MPVHSPALAATIGCNACPLHGWGEVSELVLIVQAAGNRLECTPG